VVDEKFGSVALYGRRSLETAVGASPDATVVIYNFRRLKSALKISVNDCGLKPTSFISLRPMPLDLLVRDLCRETAIP